MPIAPIVAGTDGSASAERAVEKAAELAAAMGAPLHIVMSCETGANGSWMAAAGAAASGVATTVVAYDERAREQAEEVVSRSEQRIRANGLESRTHVCSGDPAEALLTVAADEGAQMIVVGNRGMVGARRLL